MASWSSPNHARAPLLTNMLPRRLIVVAVLLLSMLPGYGDSGVRVAAAAADSPVYTDALASGWSDYSWGSTIALSNASPIHGGSASIAVTITQPWAGLSLHANTAFSSSDYTAVRFWIHGGSAGGQPIDFKVIDSANGNWTNHVRLTPQAGVWTVVTVTLANVGSPVDIGGLVWQDGVGSAQPTFYVDDIALISAGGTPPPVPGVGPALSVNAAAGQHLISPYIYGMNFADASLAAELRLPVRRWGGNSTSRYNWQNNTTNTGSDWYFENIVQDSSASADAFVAQDQGTHTKTLLTVPLIGWVSKDSPANHPFDCGFKVSKYGTQDQTDPWDADCGDGQSGGANLTGNDPHDTSIAITQSFVSGWVNHLVGLYKTAAQGGVQFYDLDNEPMLWNSTHRDVHPAATTYDELRDRTYAYAPAVKAADPTALTLGPVLWGWCAYFNSAADGCGPGPDRAAHANMDFVAWYLQQMHAYETQHGIRILDYLDLHAYPQGTGIFSDSPGGANTQALRLRSTRQLWDPTYIDESWIGQAVRLIPRMHDWVNSNYPGTKIAISEYSWGALGYLNGALAQADVLGIFGREGLDLATLWGPPTATQPGAYAFRMYRNYDGQSHGFGETSVQAASADQSQVAIYAARRSSDGALTLMIINKTGTPLTSTVALSNYLPAATAQVYLYSGANLQAIVRQPEQAVNAGGFTAAFPANSITLVVAAPALRLGKTAQPVQNVRHGDIVTYTLALADDGRSAQLTDPLPPELGFGNLSQSPALPAATYDKVGGAVTLTGTLPAGGITITYTAQVTSSASGPAGPVIVNTATLTDTVTGQAVHATAIVNSYRVFLPLATR
jgi:hypothetical protein